MEDIYAAEVALTQRTYAAEEVADVNEPQQPTEEQLVEALKQIKTEDVVLQTVATLVNLAGQKLSLEGAKDAAEAKKAIDAARQLVPLVPGGGRGPDPERAGPGPDAVRQGEPGSERATEPPPAPPPRRSGRLARDRRLRGLRLLQPPR